MLMVHRRRLSFATHRLNARVQRGFTLVELVVACGLIGMLAAGAGWFWINSVNMMGDVSAEQAAQSSARTALERVVREVRETKYNDVGAVYCVGAMQAARLVLYRTQGSYLPTCSSTAAPTSANNDFAVTIERASGASTLTLSYAGTLADPALTSTLVADVTGFTLRFLAQDAATTTTDPAALRFVELTLTVQPAGVQAATARTLVALRN